MRYYYEISVLEYDEYSQQLFDSPDTDLIIEEFLYFVPYVQQFLSGELVKRWTQLRYDVLNFSKRYPGYILLIEEYDEDEIRENRVLMLNGTQYVNEDALTNLWSN